MNTQPHTVSKPNWPAALLMVASVPIVMLVCAILIEIVSVVIALQQPPSGEVDTTLQTVIFWGGMYFGIPCGLINLVAGIAARRKGWIGPKAAIAALVIGGLGLLIGIPGWVFYQMMQSFVF